MTVLKLGMRSGMTESAARYVLRIDDATMCALQPVCRDSFGWVRLGRDHFAALAEQESYCRALPGPNVIINREQETRGN